MPLWLLAQPAGDSLSQPFVYTGYSQPAYPRYTRESRFVAMPDSIRLAVDILLPEGGPDQEAFPVVFILTPYGRSYVIPHMGPVKHLASQVLGLGWGPEYDVPRFFKGAELLLAHGYALVVADMRGTGASFGHQMPLMPSLGADGKAMIDWIATQPWCDGQVGMMGPSYLGWAQFATAAQRPAALKCIMPEVIAFDVYTGANRPGGIPAQRWLRGFSDRLSGYNRNHYDLRGGYLPALPVVDEDGDGQLADEWIRLDSARLAAGEAVFADGQIRPVAWYVAATRAHLDNILIEAFLDSAYQYFDSQAPAPYDHLGYPQTSAGSFTPVLAETGIPVYHVGGWFDGFTRGTTKLYATLAPTNPSRLFIAPRYHFPRVAKAYRRYLDYPGSYAEQLATEQLRFFDRYLKDIPNGIDTEPPVVVYMMHEGWLQAPDWPHPAAEVHPLHLHPGGRLAAAPPTAPGLDAYPVDFSVRSDYGKDSLNRWLMYETGPEVVMTRTAVDAQCLTYDTAPLDQPLRVLGHPVVHLWASADQPAADFFVYLCDVDPQGQSTYITEGQLRANWHALVDDDAQVLGQIDVRPDLPWHGYRAGTEDPAPFAGGAMRELVFDLQPVAWRIQPGHRLRLVIAGADAGNFSFHPQLCEDPSDPASCRETTLFLHRSPAYPSRIELPLLPLQAETASRLRPDR